MFTFVPEANAIPIAKVVGGNLDGIRLWLRDDDNEVPLAENGKRCECGKVYEKVNSAMKHRAKGTCSYMKLLKQKLKDKEIPEEPFDDVDLKDGNFRVLPYEISFEDGTPSYTQRIYIAGQSGCGKSRWAGNWIRDYVERYPDKEVFTCCHTPINEDPAYKDIEAEQVDLDDPDFAELCEEEVLAGGLLEGKICIFDDIDKLEKQAKTTAQRLLGQTLMMGRKQGIPVCFCNHLGADRNATRDILNAATAAVVFPRGGSPGQLDYLLKKHVGLSTVGVRAILEGRPRWAYVHREHPCYVLTNKRACSMEELDKAQKEKEKNARITRVDLSQPGADITHLFAPRYSWRRGDPPDAEERAKEMARRIKELK